MALSGSVRTNESEGRSVEVRWTATQNIAQNKSTLSWSLVGTGSAGGWVLVNEIRVTINGSVVMYRDQNNHTECWVGTVLGSGTIDIPHNADGTEIFGITVEAGIYQWSINTSGTSVFTLDTIPRATTPTLSAESTEMGQNLTISLARASSSFTHTLKYVFGNASGTIASGVATSRTWTVPLTLANQIPNATSGYGTIVCETYNGSTLIGTKTVRFTATVPSSVIPSISSITLEDPTGNRNTFGGYVQSKSKVKVTVASSGAYGSTITKVQTTVNGVTTTTNPYTSGFITESGGTKTVSVVVTDSRGRTKTSSTSYTVLSYISPTITELSSRRCTQAGVDDDAGAYMKITYAGSITALNNLNAKNLLVRYKKQSVSSWTNAVNVQEYSRNTSVIVAADVNSSYDISFVVADSFGSAEKTWKISTAFTLMDFNSSGKGIAFGKVSESDKFECALDSEFKSVKTTGGADLDTVKSGLETANTNIANRNKIITVTSTTPKDIPYNTSTEVASANLEKGHTYLITGSCSYGASFPEMTVDIFSFAGSTVAAERNSGLGGGGVMCSVIFTAPSDGKFSYNLWQGNTTTQRASSIRFDVVQLI